MADGKSYLDEPTGDGPPGTDNAVKGGRLVGDRVVIEHKPLVVLDGPVDLGGARQLLHRHSVVVVLLLDRVPLLG